MTNFLLIFIVCLPEIDLFSPRVGEFFFIDIKRITFALWVTKLLDLYRFTWYMVRYFYHIFFCVICFVIFFSFTFRSLYLHDMIKRANNTLCARKKNILNSICQFFTWVPPNGFLLLDRIINRRLVSGLRSKSSDGKSLFFTIHPTTNVIIGSKTAIEILHT